MQKFASTRFKGFTVNYLQGIGHVISGRMRSGGPSHLLLVSGSFVLGAASIKRVEELGTDQDDPNSVWIFPSRSDADDHVLVLEGNPQQKEKPKTDEKGKCKRTAPYPAH